MSYVRWYGIPGLEFISHGNWSDAEIRVHACKEQKAHGIKVNSIFNAHDVEDAMYDLFSTDEYGRPLKDKNGKYLTDSEIAKEWNCKDFAEFMKRDEMCWLWEEVFVACGGEL